MNAGIIDNSLNLRGGAISCGTITSTTINIQNNAISAGSDAIDCGAITSKTVNTENNYIFPGSAAFDCGAIASTIVNTETNYIFPGSGAIDCYCIKRADDYPHRQAAIAQEDIAYESLRRELTMGQEVRINEREPESRRRPRVTCSKSSDDYPQRQAAITQEDSA